MRDAEIDEIERLFKYEPNLSYSLLCMVNSVMEAREKRDMEQAESVISEAWVSGSG